jgi:toxin ParE1/3/4
MKYRVRLRPEAEADLAQIHKWVATASSDRTAKTYVDRILGHLQGFEQFPHRGVVRDDVIPGLRVIGFERRISIAFVVEDSDVVILRILYAGRQHRSKR